MTVPSDDKPTHDAENPPAPPSDSGEQKSPAQPRPQGETARQVADVEGIVQEIREGLAGISAYELDLQRREERFRQERRRLERDAQSAAHAELEAAQQQLEQERRATEAQAAAVHVQRRRLDALMAHVSAREAELGRQQTELDQQGETLARRVQKLAERFRRRKADLRRRISTVRTCEQEAGRQLRLTREEAARRVDELRRMQSELEARETRLADAEGELRAREETLEQRTRDAADRFAAAQRQASETVTARSGIERQREALREAVDKLRVENQRLQHEQSALRGQTDDLTAQRESLEVRSAALDARQHAQEASEYAAAARESRLESRLARIAARFRQRRAQLRQRITTVRTHEQELNRRLRLARDDIVHQRAAVVQAQEANAARVAELARSDLELAAQRDGLQREREEHSRHVAACEARVREVADERERLADERRRLQHQQQTVADQRASLADDAQALQRRAQAIQDADQQLAEQRDRLNVQCNALEEAQAASEARSRELDRRTTQLADESAALRAAQQQLAAQRTALDERAAELAEAEQRAEQVQEQAQQYHEEALALRDQVEARDAESRQAALAQEVEREELDRERDALGAARDELDGLRAQREQELASARQTLTEYGTQLEEAQRSLLAAPRRWWLRSGVVSVVAGALAAAGWLGLHPVQYRATAEIRIDSERPGQVKTPATVAAAGMSDSLPAAAAEQTDAAAAASSPSAASGDWAGGVLTEHRHALLDPGLAASLNAATAAAWRDAEADERATVTCDADALALRLSVVDRDKGAAERLAVAVAAAYAERVNAVPEDSSMPPQYLDLVLWRGELQMDIDAVGKQRSEHAAALAAAPQPTTRETLAETARALQAESAQVVTTLTEQRAALSTLLASEVPPGSVDPADVAAALEDDTIFKEHRQELLATTQKYRTELVVGMVLLVEPLQSLQQVLVDYEASLVEQRALEPPAELVPVLEACADDVVRGQELLGKFAEQWRSWVETAQAVNIAEDSAEQTVVTLVEHQNHVAESARRVSDDVVKLVDENGARVEKLSTSGDGSTREVVVAVVLRADHAALRAAVEPFLTAAAQTALTGNIELDTHDRRLRGLRMGIAQRRELVRQRLQLDADRTMRDQHNTRLAEVREQVRTLEARRETLVNELAATWQSIRELDVAARQHDECASRVQQDDEQIERLETQLANLNEKLAALQRRNLRPDRAAVGGVSTAVVNPQGYRGALGAALAGALVTWLGCITMIMKPPGRRTESERLLVTLTTGAKSGKA